VIRVQNADEFLLWIRKIQTDYDRVFRSRIDEIRNKYARKPEAGPLDQSLEAHSRAYVVNALLAALNWRLDACLENGLPNLIPEAPIRSEERRSVRFLDYLGLERQTANPLLVVETKRPSAGLPSTLAPAATFSEVVCRGPAGERLNSERNRWLQDLRDYVRSVYERAKKVPRRVVITNSMWLILFLEPSEAFLENASCDPTNILVFMNRSDIEKRYRELFNFLEHGSVLGEAPGGLPFYVEGTACGIL
jgi:hypothetical protein